MIQNIIMLVLYKCKRMNAPHGCQVQHLDIACSPAGSSSSMHGFLFWLYYNYERATSKSNIYIGLRQLPAQMKSFLSFRGDLSCKQLMTDYKSALVVISLDLLGLHSVQTIPLNPRPSSFTSTPYMQRMLFKCTLFRLDSTKATGVVAVSARIHRTTVPASSSSLCKTFNYSLKLILTISI